MRKYVPDFAHLIPQEAKCVFSGVIYDVYQWQQKMYDDSFETFEMLRRADTAKIIAIKDGKIVVTYQQQPGKNWFYDYPGGRIDTDDNDELAGAKRELLEETGMRFRNWKLIEVHQPFNKIDWLVYTFLATDFIDQIDQKLDAGEKIQVELATLDQIREYAKQPDSQYLRFRGMEKIHSLEQLLELPALYDGYCR